MSAIDTYFNTLQGLIAKARETQSAAMEEAAGALALPDAAQTIVDEVYRVIGENN